jgi:peptidoglycan glycosyltransferase
MNRRFAAITLLLCGLALAVVAGTVSLARSRSAAELVDVRGLLVHRDADWGRQQLAGLEKSWAMGPEARTGLALLAALDGEQVDAERVSLAALGSYPVPALLDRALEEERYEGCLRLTELLEAAGGPSFPAYRAAALLELGRIEEARAVQIAEAPRTRLRGRLSEVLDADLSAMLVRDRRGVLLGRVVPGDEGGFVPADGMEPGLLPRTAVSNLDRFAPARSVRLTMDAELSRLAQKSLGSYRGSIVVIDPWDGSVLAAVSDRRTARREDSAAFEQLREPASIAKLITTSAALRAGIDVDAVLADLTCRGSLPFPEGRLYCSAVNGRLRGLDRAMAVSCNVAFAHLGSLVGGDALVEEYRRFGFDHGVPAEGPFGRVLVPDARSRDLGELSIGLEASAITPVHAALQAGTIANGGRMHEPQVHRATDSYLGLSERVMGSDPGWQVLDEASLAALTGAMKAVVAPGGTAARVAPSSFPIALKTGTASEPSSGFHVNYIGFGPASEPRFAFAVRLTHQRTSRRVRNAAFAVTRRFLRNLASWSAAHPPEPADLRRPVVSTAS